MKKLMLALCLLYLVGCGRQQTPVGKYEYTADYYDTISRQTLVLATEQTLELKSNGQYALHLDREHPNKVSYGGKYTKRGQKLTLYHKHGFFQGRFEKDNIILDPRKLHISSPGRHGRFMRQ